MGKNLFKILTAFVTMCLTQVVIAGVVKPQEFKTHLRWNLYVPQSQIVIKKEGDNLILESLQKDILTEVQTSMANPSFRSQYLQSTKVEIVKNQKTNVWSISVPLSERVDLFSFYRGRENKYVIDFWIDEDVIEFKKAALAKPISKPTVKKLPVVTKKKIKKVAVKKPLVKEVIEPASDQRISLKQAAANKTGVSQVGDLPTTYPGYRDFRYGAPFIWNYEADTPKMGKIINLARKTAEYFYPITDRNPKDGDEKESHLQLTINLYKKKKWGLMNRSIKLYNEKYGTGATEVVELHEYLKANAILRDNFDKKNRPQVKMAMAIYSNLAEKTNNYLLQRAIYKYLISFYSESGEYVRGLEYSKKFFVASKDNYDKEETEYAAEGIFYNLAALSQIDKIKNLLDDSTMNKLVPRQVRLAYKVYTLLKLDDTEEIIRIIDKVKNSLAGDLHPSLIFNVAEAYFRKADYENAIEWFDKYITAASFNTKAGEARVRLALSYELLERSPDQVEQLYRTAIDRTPSGAVSFEAKLRYVAFTNLRKIRPTTDDKEKRVFLSTKDVKLNYNLKKMLWLVRLRTFVVDREYVKAMTYLNTIPLRSMKPEEIRVFEADGGEAVFGIIRQKYVDSAYSEVISFWKKYKTKYVDKVATDPFVNFIVGHSYLKLSLYDGFESLYREFAKMEEAPSKTYPIWSGRFQRLDNDLVLLELELLRSIGRKLWDSAKRSLANYKERFPSNNKNHYYQGIIDYHKGKTIDAIKSFESYLANESEDSIYDISEIALMLKYYTESLYKENKVDRFKKVADAISKDTRYTSSKNPVMKSVRERVAYLYIETIAASSDPAAALVVESEIKKFGATFKDSIYAGRINYLLGLSYIQNKKVKEGKDILEKLVQDDKASQYLKELAKSELSLLRIKSKSI